MSRTLRAPSRLAARSRQVLFALPTVLSAATIEETYYPELLRKSDARIAAEHVYWLSRYGQTPDHYFHFGLDRKGRPGLQQFLPYQRFRTIRDAANRKHLPGGYNHLALVRDKFVFGQLLNSLGYPTPKNFAFASHDAVDWIGKADRDPISALLRSDLDVICKPIAGEGGEGIFQLRTLNGKITIGGKPATINDLRLRLRAGFLLQERIEQHPAYAALNAASINTLRIVTIRKGGDVNVFGGFLRIGVGDIETDNWQSGGLIAGIDFFTGALKGRGMFKSGARGFVTSHPSSGIPLDGYSLPHVADAVRLVRRIHRRVFSLHSVGWDVALTPHGPTVIEGNDNWGGLYMMSTDSTFKARFLAAHS